MDNVIRQTVLNKIKEFDTIILCRHIRPDGDAVGSTMALKDIICDSFPGKRVFIERKDETPLYAFLGDEGPVPSDTDFAGALLIVLDTNESRISSDRAGLAKYVMRIDHHIKSDDFGDFSWIEDQRNSVCEMIAEFVFESKDVLKLSKHAAECLFTGLVTDTGRFKFRGTTPITMMVAAYLLDQGIDFERIYAFIDVKEYDVIMAESALSGMIKLTKSGVAYLHITNEIKAKYGLSEQQASDTVMLLEHIKGSIIWLVFIDNGDGSTRVRLRARFVPVEPVARQYNGGGHELAAGATVHSEEEKERLLADLDLLHETYKKEHPDVF